MAFLPNKFQRKIGDWVLNGRGNAVVNAVAGSGKTSTLVWLASMLMGVNGLFVAFNVKIAEELGRRLNGTSMIAKTIHSVGMGILRAHLGKLNVDTEGKKYREICERLIAEANTPEEDRDEAVKNLRKLVDLVRLTLVNPMDESAVLDLISRFGLDLNGYHVHVSAALQEGNTLAKKRGWIDFTDMIYLPVVMNLKPVTTFDWLFVDECQDLNACQLAIVLKLVKEGGRMLFVGDRHQAIYGFAGADARAFDKIIDRTNAVELPLSVCYRCPVSILDLARKVGIAQTGAAIVPYIEAADGAHEGEINTLPEDDLIRFANPGDMVLCRTNAGLIRHCIRFIRNKIPATVRGRDIGKMLTAVLRRVAKSQGFRYDMAVLHMEEYRMAQVRFLDQKKAEQSAYESLNDKVDCLIECIEGFNCASMDELCREIEALFSDKEEGVIFSSVHRAKGLEADNVLILEPSKLPLKWEGQQTWQMEQELNLEYVAYTRAMVSLTFLN